ncbi:MAG: HAD-IA family hydrolase [Patescibacteria group bacterium]
MKKVVIFDVDGVLLDSVGRSVAALCRAITKHDLPPHFNLITEKWGQPFKAVLIPALALAGKWPLYKQQLVERDLEVFFETSVFGGAFGLKEKLQSLKDANLALGVLTNRSDKMLEKAFTDLGLDSNIFDFLHSADCGVQKPNSQVFEKISEFYRPDEIIFVGDSIICDLPAAYNHEPAIDFVGITSAIHSKKNFISAGVPEDMIFDSVTDFIDDFLSNNFADSTFNFEVAVE